MLDSHETRLPNRYLAAVVLLLSMLLSSLAMAQDVIKDLTPDTPENTPADESVDVTEDAPPAGSIDVKADANTDAQIQRRLNGIYAELDSLGTITASVRSGIVTLSGTVTSAQSGEQAVRIARQVVGVVDVIDALEVDTNVDRRISSTLDDLQKGLVSLVAALPLLIVALLIVVAFWVVGRWIGAWSRVFEAIAPNVFIADLLSLLARSAVVLVGLIVALTLLDATSLIGSVLGAAGIIGLAIGFAVRDTVENFIASILLSLRAPFTTHDYVRIGEHEGSVARLTSRATILISIDGNHLRVPNAQVYKSVIINFSRKPERRFEFDIGVDTDLDLNVAQTTALQTIYRVPGVLSEPAATVLVTRLGDSNVTLTVRAWIDQRKSDLLKVKSESIRLVKQAFDNAGITMPEPIYRLRFQEGDLYPWSVSESTDSGRVDGTERKAGSTDHKAEPAARDAGSEVTADRTDESKRERKVAPVDPTVAAEACDTSADDAVNKTIERELSEGTSRNLLNREGRTE